MNPQQPKRHFLFDSFSNTITTPLRLATKANEMPKVWFTEAVDKSIKYLVEQSAAEIGWYGLVEECEGGYIVTDIYVPKQLVTGVTVDIDPEANVEMVERIFADGKDPSQLRYHGHSHVNMGVSPSGVDQDMIDDHLEHTDFFIRSIHNKKEQVRMDVFDKRAMLVHNNVEVELLISEEEDAMYKALDKQLKTYVAKKVYAQIAPLITSSAQPNKQSNPSSLRDLGWGEYGGTRYDNRSPRDKTQQYPFYSHDETEEEIRRYNEALSDPFYVSGEY